MRQLLKTGLPIVLAAPSQILAQETTTITFDALGRVVTVSKSGGPASGTQTTYSLDSAGNRTNVKVINSPSGSSGGDQGSGASVVQNPVYVVVPLNGYTLIRVR